MHATSTVRRRLHRVRPGLLAGDDGHFELSPDGRYAILGVTTFNAEPPSEFKVDDVDAGTFVTIDGRSDDFGWGADDTLFSVDDDGAVKECVPTTGACTTSRPDLADHPDSGASESGLRLGGRAYEV